MTFDLPVATNEITIDITNRVFIKEIKISYIGAALNSYTVSFNSNGGSSVNPQTVFEGALAELPIAPTKPADSEYVYTFYRWCTDADCTIPFDFDTPITEDITLYADYTAEVIGIEDYVGRATSVAELRATEDKESTTATSSLVFKDAGLSNAADITNVQIGAVTLNGDIGTNSSNNPKYYTSGYNMRVYTGNKITFTCEENMTSIKFTYTSNYETGLSASVGALNGTTWTGKTTSVSFTNTVSSQVRITAVEVTYGEEAVVVSDVKLDFGFDIAVSDWEAINNKWEISDYGVMLFKSNKTSFDSLTPVQDAFNAGYAPAIIHEGTPELPEATNGYYSYRGTVTIPGFELYSKTFMAAPFILIDEQYYFFTERQESVYSLAEYYSSHSGCELSYNALLTILANKGE